MSQTPESTPPPPPTAPPPPPPTSQGMAPAAKWVIGGIVGLVVLGGIAFAAVSALFSTAEDDAVKVAPADAVLYGNVFLEPSNGQKIAIRELLEKFPDAGTSAEAKELIERLLDEAFSESGITYTDDVEPWLGKQIAFFFTSFGPDEPSGAALIHTEDQDATEDTIDKLREVDEEMGTIEERSYEGVDYDLGPDETAIGYVESFLVVGSESGFKAAVDGAKGESLADSERFQGATTGLTEDRLAILYLDGKGLFESSGVPPALLSGPLLGAAQEPFAGILFARNDGVVFESSSTVPGGAAGLFAPLLGGADDAGLLPDLPGDSWGALGAPNFGQSVQVALDALGASGLPGLTPDVLSQQLEQEFGINIERDFLSWMGDIGVFVEGTEPNSVGGGLVVESTDEDASDAAVDKIAQLLRQNGAPVQPSEFPDFGGFTIRDPEAPEAIHVIAADRVIAAFGKQAALDALGTDPSLGGSEGYERALDALGEGFIPSIYFDIQKIIDLIEVGTGAGFDPIYQEEVKPNLDPLTHVVFGSKVDGNTVIQRVVIGVQ
jgi:hypothetical protein